MVKKILALFTKTSTLFCLLLVINLCVILHCFADKKGFHSDEQWSYARANSAQVYLDKDTTSFLKVSENAEIFNRWTDNSAFADYLTVQKDNKFSYENINHNLKYVEHPPLYFVLIHTITSFFPNSFSKWYAGAINLVAFVLIYLMLFKLSKLLLKDDKLALCVTALWGFSVIGVSTIVYLRMYVLQTLFSICLCYEMIKIIQNNQATNKELALIFLFSFLGIFNQYNAIFFSFFATLFGCLIFLRRKNHKLMFKLACVMLLSVIMLFVIYPQAYEVLFDSWRAKQVLSNLTYTNKPEQTSLMEIIFAADIRLSNIIPIISEQLFAFNHTDTKIVIFGLIIGIVASIYLRLEISAATKWLLGVFIFYQIFLLSMPYMHIFHSRYYMSTMPFFALFSIMILSTSLSKLGKNKMTAVIVLLVAVNSLCFDFKEKSPYAFRWEKAEQTVYDEIKAKKVFIDNGQSFIWLHSMVYYLANADKVFITKNICDDVVIKNILKTKDPIIFTYASYIPKTNRYQEIKCLKDIGIDYETTVCPSQHCYDVWKKHENNLK